MYFKRLELFGFKSFAERTVFHFEPGVTAIVGPNGCGKTNCVDAIRWVLGEQNARDLRGHKMEDVIFNGTQEIPPLGFAEVSLTFANEDRILPIEYNEVTLTRRVYRSGESEYLLNKLPVRLRDIQDLLMGTGIGVDSYSIIGQGQVNLILSAHPEDRRTVFEEASGITKYKTKKREALRKLEQTEHNLLRVQDIVIEVERQLRSIERQVGKARRYQERFEHLKQRELAIAAVEHHQVHERRAALTAQRHTLEEEAREVTARWEALQQREAHLSTARELLLHQLAERQTARADCRGALEGHQRELQLKATWQQELEQQCATLTAECDALRARMQQLRMQRADAEQALSAVRDEESQHAGRVQTVETELATLARHLAATQQQLQSTKQALVDHNAQLAKTHSELAKLSATAHAHQARMRRLRADHAELTAQTDALTAKLQDVRQQLEALASQGVAHTQRLEQVQGEHVHQQREVEHTTERLNQLQRTKAEHRATCQWLEQLWQRHEGLSAGAKALLDAQHPEIIGIVGDLIDVQPGWESAVELVLGALAQAVVVRQTSDAWQLLEWLQTHGTGRAHFVPLDQVAHDICGAGRTGLPPAVAGLIGPASQLVTARDTRVAPLMQRALADVWCVENLTACTHWPEGCVRLIDRAGNFWMPGVLTGRSRDDQTSVVGRRARLEAAQHRLLAIEQDLEETTSQWASSAETLTALKDAVEQGTAAVQDLHRQQDAQQLLLRQMEEEERRVTQERSVVALEGSEAETEYREVEQQQHMTREQDRVDTEKLAQLEQQLTTYQTALEQAIGDRETKLVDLAGLTAHRDTVSARRQTLDDVLQDSSARAAEAEQALASREAQIRESHERTARFAQDVQEHQAAITRLTGEQVTMDHAVADVTQQVDSYKQQLDALGPDLTREQRALETVREQQRQADLAIAENTYQSQSLTDRMHNYYKCDIPAAHEPLLTADELLQQQTEARALREQLEAIGPVSLDSIADQEELTQRHTFLTTQQHDLAQAQASLKDAITKMNRETRKLFLETFEQIQREFQHFFKLLFGGGTAELLLMDESQVLDCGIEIQAQPPGKKLQAITLLSGGEQAMTAIALLFALFKVRPSPFCVLDEIDAPLDEANVDRFTRGLGEFIQLSQFIIITHNKRTITSTDLMYGITMEQAGVSKIVSVKFTESPRDGSLHLTVN